MAGLNWMDFMLIVALLVGLVMGYQQGLLRQVIGLAALYIGAILSIQYYRPVADALHSQLKTTPGTVLQTGAFFIILLTIMVVVNGLAYDAYQTTKVRFFPLLDHFGGAVVGAFNIAILTILVLLPVSFMVHAEAWQAYDGFRQWLVSGLDGSTMAHAFGALTPTLIAAVRPWLPSAIPSIFSF